MDKVGVMQVVYCFCDLVDNVLLVFFLQICGFSVLSNESMEIDIHMLEEKVDIFVISGSDGLLEIDDIAVFQLPQEHDLSVGPLGICGIREGIEIFLQGLYCFCLPVDDFPHVPVCPTSNLFDKLEVFKDMRLNFISHVLV